MSYCYLFVPGHRFDRFAKAYDTKANFVVIDLEDAVAPQDKQIARDHALDWLAQKKYNSPQTIIRINGYESAYFKDDVNSLASKQLNFIMIPKVESPSVLDILDSLIPDKKIRFIPIIESALGLKNAYEIAQSKRVERLAFGSVDFQLDTGIPTEGEALLFARSTIVIASAAANLRTPIDGVTLEIDNTNQLISDIKYAKSLGFGAKLCIHPSQVQPTVEGFKPSESELAWAKEICKASDQAAGSAVRLNGKLVDLPVVLRAQRIIEDFK
jgi:citrate lyase subunit beta/citryl-CoA lyase